MKRKGRCGHGAKPKLTEQQIDQMREDFANGMTYAKLGEKYGIHRFSVADQLRRFDAGVKLSDFALPKVEA